VSGSDSSPRLRALVAYDQSVGRVRGVDKVRLEALQRLGIHTVRQLLNHTPLRYLDFSTRSRIVDLTPGVEATVVGTVHSVSTRQLRPKMTITEVAIVDDSQAALVGVWFNQDYIVRSFFEGQIVAFAGAPRFEFGLTQMRAPFFEVLSDEAQVIAFNRILPIHPSTSKLSTNCFRRIVSNALTSCGDLPDSLPTDLRLSRGLITRRDALSGLHFPRNDAHLADARRRLAYEEMLLFQLAILSRRPSAGSADEEVAERVNLPLVQALTNRLPFTLSADQEVAIAEILRDIANPRPMNRLLAGDVGTGKTLVAAHALIAVMGFGRQSLMTAPTEILVRQHCMAIGTLLDSLGIKWASLTSFTTAKERTVILDDLRAGKLGVLFGTQAILEQSVKFSNLALAVIDEQHRYGVRQRLSVREKGDSVDLLVMSATPIPRSLALTYYGDLDVSYLREHPIKRADDHVVTRCAGKNMRRTAYRALKDEVSQGRQAYVICALVEDSEASEVRSALSEADRLRNEVFPGLRIGVLTGRMGLVEKTKVMEEFRSGHLDILVSTTVVEVGVDVPNATVMIVEDAERYGLAQLHQLRGRIGRGMHRGQFFALADPKTDVGRDRMLALQSSNNGLELAEMDLDLRGPGEFFGERQSGLPELQFVSLARDVDIIEQAREDACKIFQLDPELHSPLHRGLTYELEMRIGINLGCVSSG